MNYVAIDPMAVILPEKYYLIWVEIHHPNTPLVDDLAKLFKRIPAEDKKVILVEPKRLVRLAKQSKKPRRQDKASSSILISQNHQRLFTGRKTEPTKRCSMPRIKYGSGSGVAQPAMCSHIQTGGVPRWRVRYHGYYSNAAGESEKKPKTTGSPASWKPIKVRRNTGRTGPA